MRRRFFLVLNAGAGASACALGERVALDLTCSGALVDCARPTSFDALHDVVREAGRSGRYDAIVAAGGDGTIRIAAAALSSLDIPLGIVPCGTANVLAQEIGLKATAATVCGMLQSGPAIPVSCARANGESFLLMAGAGFDGRVIGALNHALKSRVGKIAYAGPLLGALVKPIDTLSITIDGRQHEASWVVVANARHYGGRFVLAPRTGIQERGLEAILFKARSRAILVQQLMSLALGRLDSRAAGHGDVEMHKCALVHVAAHHPVPVQVDGDVFGTTPLEIEAGSDVVRLIVPA
jgi:diacylglycerol kinase family enzyme